MSPVRRAVIDVGTNSVKLLVADVTGCQVAPVLEQSEQTRLGRDFYETRRLQPRAILDTAHSVARFTRAAEALNPCSVGVIATSAARDAVNAEELVTAIRKACGLAVTVISGEQEAEWAFRGVATDSRLHDRPLLILEVGGGSTQIIRGERGHHTACRSFPLGSVRLLEKLRPEDPPAPADLARCREWLEAFFSGEIGPALKPTLHSKARQGLRFVGTGGTTTILARMQGKHAGFDREEIERTRLSRARVQEWMARLWSLPLAERRQIVGLPPNRADVILMGVAIYEAAMTHLDLAELWVSTRGVRFGAVMEAT
jgi:exopolyphosphatase/guanosine-5'-triphosphate,3'-diphosphate pyrophosphatase